MWTAISAVVSWFLELIGYKIKDDQAAKQVQAQQVGESKAEQGLEAAQNQAQQQEKQNANALDKVNADAASGDDDSLRRETDDVNATIRRTDG
jgi:hypothetical protein